MNRTVIAETVRRQVTSIGYLAYVALLAILGVGMAQVDRPATLWPILVAFLAIAMGATVIGPEFSSGSLQLILVKPINRAVYLVSRVIGVVLCVWIAASVAFLGECVGRALRGEIPWKALAMALLLTAIEPILAVVLLALLGSLTRGYSNVALYFGVQIGLMISLALMQRRVPLSVTNAIRVVQDNLFPDAPYSLNRDWLLLVLSNAAIAIVLACFAFRRREVPYGAD